MNLYNSQFIPLKDMRDENIATRLASSADKKVYNLLVLQKIETHPPTDTIQYPTQPSLRDHPPRPRRVALPTEEINTKYMGVDYPPHNEIPIKDTVCRG
jgi:hypothetical protein